MKQLLTIVAALVALVAGPAAQAQTPPPATPPPGAPSTAAPPRPAQPTAAPPRTTVPRAPSTGSAVSVHVTDKSGNGIREVSVAMTGPVDRSGVTAADGTVAFRSVRAGTYRLRFEHDGYLTLEREFVAGPRGSDVSVALNPAPPAPKPVVVPPPAAETPPPVQESHRAVEPRTLSIPDWLEKNLIGGEPQKTSLIACTDAGAARILQVKDPLNNQQNATADQLLYVVAGGGVVRVRDQEYKATPGSFVLIPRGVAMSARREGRNPMIALTVAMGTPCNESTPLAR